MKPCGQDDWQDLAREGSDMVPKKVRELAVRRLLIASKSILLYLLDIWKRWSSLTFFALRWGHVTTQGRRNLRRGDACHLLTRALSHCFPHASIPFLPAGLQKGCDPCFNLTMSHGWSPSPRMTSQGRDLPPTWITCLRAEWLLQSSCHCLFVSVPLPFPELYTNKQKTHSKRFIKKLLSF